MSIHSSPQKEPVESAFSQKLSLGEGNTPLVRSRSIGPSLGIPNLFFKLENLNPSGSYKDRFASRIINDMKENGLKTCIATSSGNTGAALAAYSAAAGLQCIILVVDGAPRAKLKQMQVYGAELVMIHDFGKSEQVTRQVAESLRTLTERRGLPLPISAYKYCPTGMAGVESIAHEIVNTLEEKIDVFVPAGGGGLTLAVARGMLARSKKGKVHCVQPQGNDTMATSLRTGTAARAVSRSTTAISGLQVANIFDGNEVIDACQQLGGTGYVVEDEAVFKWHRELAMKEGIFSEPAGAVALAGLAQAMRQGEINPERNYVCLITGSGFKDLSTVDARFGLPDVNPVSTDEAMEKLRFMLA
ncbi:PLP-dependent lyase/thiolase [Larkinella bovis]|uniref:PLP-dependent lyase/thiolase n=1 Tax=Larkinella bovis TaxID=683041 RepID=A0ABW0IG46_9BACT